MRAHKKYSILITTMLLVGLSQIVFPTNKPVLSSFSGEWKMENNTKGTFILSLDEFGSQLSGQHCIVAMEGSKIDCPIDLGTDVKTISGTISGNTASVTYKSAWSDNVARATIQIIDNNTLKWTLFKNPTWEHYFPKTATLKKQ